MYNKNAEIFVVTNRTGYIPQMRMCGPILQPIKVPIQLCLSMVCAGVDLYQVDIKSGTNMKLTPLNVMDDTKFDTTSIETATEEEIPPVVDPATVIPPVVVAPDPPKATEPPIEKKEAAAVETTEKKTEGVFETKEVVETKETVVKTEASNKSKHNKNHNKSQAPKAEETK